MNTTCIRLALFVAVRRVFKEAYDSTRALLSIPAHVAKKVPWKEVSASEARRTSRITGSRSPDVDFCNDEERSDDSMITISLSNNRQFLRYKDYLQLACEATDQ